MEASLITSVESGRTTSTFTSYDAKRPSTDTKTIIDADESRSFSIVSTKRSLDLEVMPSPTSMIERDQLVAAFRWLKTYVNSSHRAVSTPFNVQHKTHVNAEFKWYDLIIYYC
jgi:hypothetical protein